MLSKVRWCGQISGVMCALAFSVLISERAGADKGTFSTRENWVSRLSASEQKALFNPELAPASDRAADFSVPDQSRLGSASALPSVVDWRNSQGVNWVSPILNQGNCGSCVAFASVATLETQYNITAGIPGLNPSFSTQQLFTCAGGACQFGFADVGIVARFLQNKGIVDEACAPYTMGATGQTVKCNTICGDWQNRLTKITNYTKPTDGTLDANALKQALNKGPVVTTLLVYADFLTYASGVYKHSSGDGLGGHAVSMVGYDDAKRAWIIRNSWGEEWGDKGFAYMSYDDISGIGQKTWGFELTPASGYVSVREPKGRPYWSGTMTLQAESTIPGTGSVELQVSDEQSRVVYSTQCQQAQCKAPLDTKTLKDGKYDVIAIAKGNGQSVSSMHESFFVLNSSPNMSIDFTPDSGVDLSKPLKDRVVFKVQAQSVPVPMTGVVFHLSDGIKEVLTRSTAVVVPGLTMGLRTQTVPNGKYTMWFSGLMQTSSANVSVESRKVQIQILNGKQ